jgi:Family of unknown function (DUF5317)
VADGTNGPLLNGRPPGDDARVFILYAVVAGLILGILTGGSAARLGALRLSWAPLIVLGMVVQLALFSSPLGNALGDAAPAVYVLSNVTVLIAVAANLAVPGLVLVLAGGASNLLAIVANGGYMPVSPGALEAMGRFPKLDYSNSAPRDVVALGPLTDIFTMPTWVPMANVFSVGDILIGVGVAVAVVAAMHGRGVLATSPSVAGGGETA